MFTCAPHFGQKAESSGISFPHFLQNINTSPFDISFLNYMMCTSYVNRIIESFNELTAHTKIDVLKEMYGIEH